MAHKETGKLYNGTRATIPVYTPALGEPSVVKQADGTYRLAVGTGSTLLSALPYTGDNALLFDVRSPLYGAMGDGTTNDGAAIRAAVAAATTAGGVTYLPHGTYMMGEDGTTFGLLNLPAGARLTGPGTIKAISGQRAGVRGILCGNSDIKISDITVDMNNAVPSGATHPIYCLNTSKIRINNVTVKNSLKGGIMLDAGAGGLTDIRITNCDISTGITTNGITFYSAATNVTVDGVLVQGCRIITGVQPIDSEPIDGHADNVRIIGNYLETGNNYAITMSGASATQQNSGWEVIGNHLVGAIYCVWVKDSAVTGNRINALGTSNHAVHAYFGSSDISFTANHIYTQAGSIGFALALSSGTRPVGWSIKGNHIWTAGTASVAISLRGCGPTVVTGNVLHGVNDTTGILVQTAGGDVESIIITANDIDGYASGIVATPASTNNINALVVSDNSIRNTNGSPTATSGVTLSGTVAQLLNSFVTGNLIASVYTTPYTYGAALVKESGGVVPTFSGNGSPETVVTAGIGSLFKRRDGSTDTTLYRKETGTGNTGWIAVVAPPVGTVTMASCHLASDFSLTQSNTTLQNVTGLSLAVAASTCYEIEGWLIYDSSQIADLQLGWTVPASATLSWAVFGLRLAATTGTDTTTRSMIATAGTGTLPGTGVGTGSRVTVRVIGTLLTAGTSGTLQLQAAQNTSDATQTTIRALSRLRSLVIS